MKKFSFINLPDVEVEITSIEELFTYEQIYLVYSLIEMHECHGNAFHIALYLKCEPPIEIVEGYLEDSNGIRTPHAFNKIGDKYFDYTLEKFLPSFENLKANKYIAKRIYTKRKIPPPYFAARYGNLHILPKPTALPAAANTNPIEPLKLAFFFFSIITSLIDFFYDSRKCHGVWNDIFKKESFESFFIFI